MKKDNTEKKAKLEEVKKLLGEGKIKQGLMLWRDSLSLKEKSILIASLLLVLILATVINTAQNNIDPSKMTISASLTAHQLASAYLSNEIAADNEYKGKWIELTGQISSIGKDGLGRFFVSISDQSYGVNDIVCYFSESRDIENLSKGQQITVVGMCGGKSVYTILENCMVK